jgi:RNA polymerase sigma factor (sigma-70 family)
VTPVEMTSLARAIANRMNALGQVPFAVTIDDAQQAAVLAALRAQERFDPAYGASLKTYLGHRMVGAVRDEIERTVRGAAGASDSFDQLEEHHTAPGHYDTPERYAIRLEQLTRLNRAINRLPERYQRILALRYAEDRQLHEIGAEMGFTEARAGQILAECLKRLRNSQPEERSQ